MKIAALMALLFWHFTSSASVLEHYKTKTFRAETTKVLSPSLLEMKAQIVEGPRNISKVYIRINGLIYDQGDTSACVEDALTPNCRRLMEVIESSVIQFSLEENIGESAFYGTVFVDGKNLRQTMLREGWYKFDYKKGRSYYDIHLQKEAECKRKGIWSKVVYQPTDLRCQ